VVASSGSAAGTDSATSSACARDAASASSSGCARAVKSSTSEARPAPPFATDAPSARRRVFGAPET
jgi:hypothetical protein